MRSGSSSPSSVLRRLRPRRRRAARVSDRRRLAKLHAPSADIDPLFVPITPGPRRPGPRWALSSDVELPIRSGGVAMSYRTPGDADPSSDRVDDQDLHRDGHPAARDEGKLCSTTPERYVTELRNLRYPTATLRESRFGTADPSAGFRGHPWAISSSRRPKKLYADAARGIPFRRAWH